VYQKARGTKKQSVPESNVYQKARGTKKQSVPQSKRNQKAKWNQKEAAQRAHCTSHPTASPSPHHSDPGAFITRNPV
jgi:hypothetical protein